MCEQQKEVGGLFIWAKVNFAFACATIWCAWLAMSRLSRDSGNADDTASLNVSIQMLQQIQQMDDESLQTGLQMQDIPNVGTQIAVVIDAAPIIPSDGSPMNVGDDVYAKPILSVASLAAPESFSSDVSEAVAVPIIQRSASAADAEVVDVSPIDFQQVRINSPSRKNFEG